MRFSYAESMCDPSHYAPLAVAAEQHGWHSFVVPDSLCYPEHSDSRYPYTPDGSREFLADQPFLEPFTLIPALGALTQRLRFTTFVVKLPIRHPVLVAKQATSVAVLTGNRFGFGVGLSPWPEDFAVTGTDWKTRGRRTDEMIEIIRGLATGRFFSYRGEHYQVPSIKLCPAPSAPIPILIGGHSEAALRRAARLGDGWMHAGGGQAQDLDGALRRLAELRREYGREKRPFEVHVISLDAYTRDGVRRLEERGVSDVIVGFRNVYAGGDQPLQQKLDALRAYADNVIAKS
jgi:probable F420-dependent oxidoreductase